jgi:hypothetical protein
MPPGTPIIVPKETEHVASLIALNVITVPELIIEGPVYSLEENYRVEFAGMSTKVTTAKLSSPSALKAVKAKSPAVSWALSIQVKEIRNNRKMSFIIMVV